MRGGRRGARRARALGELRLEVGNPCLGALEGGLLHQRRLDQQIGGQRPLLHQPVDDRPRLAVDIAFRRRRQALEQAEDEVAFLRGHGASCWGRYR